MDADRLAQLLDDPERVLALAPPEATALLGQLGGLVELLRVAATTPPPSAARAVETPPRWLDVEEVAERLKITVKAAYARAGLPWSTALGAGTKRMLEADLVAYMAKGRRR